MNDKEAEILTLLQENKSYKFIQDTLNVSPSTIAQVRKLYFATDLGTKTTTNTAVVPACSGTTRSNCSENDSNPFKNIFNNQQNNYNMKNYYYSNDDELEDSEKLSLEKMRLEMAHELELKKIQKDEIEMNIKMRELKIKEEQAYSEKRKAEREGKLLVIKFRKLAKEIEDGEWVCEAMSDLYDNAVALKEEIEQYCYLYDKDTEELRLLSILSKIIEDFDTLIDETDGNDPDDEVGVTFGKELLSMVEEAKQVDFSTYD